MYTFWEVIASNAVVATILAIGAMLLSRIWKNAAALHVLWVVVLLKLFTPPFLTTELPFAFTLVPSAASADSDVRTLYAPAQNDVEQTPPAAIANARGANAGGNQQRTLWNGIKETAGHQPWPLTAVLAAIWIAGASCMSVGYALRIHRFASVIRDFEAAPPAICTTVTQLSSRLGLWRAPDVLMSSRALPPLVWSIGLCPRVILPSELFARLSSAAQATILAHELVHIRRGDYLVRLLELAATTVFWWHPVVWCARWQLRELEEQCCDGRVLELLPHQPRTYAAALVDTLEFLCERPRTPVPLRTAIYSTGSISRRIRLLTQSRTNRLSALTATLVAGLVILPLVVAFAVDPEETSKTAPDGQASAGGQAAILRGRVTNEAGARLADANGKFALRGLSKGLTLFSARALEIKQKSHLPMAVNGNQNDLEVRIKAISLPTDLKQYAVLGMQLTDVTPDLKSSYDLYLDRGALILDPGKGSDRLNVGRLAEGYNFWMVGNTRIASVREFIDQILTETAGRNADEHSVRVVYSFSTIDGDGNNTQYLKLTKDDLKQLQIVSDQLTPESP